ncbi:MAG: hypothetical protein LBM93_13620 [Oscillospiraceae bacterium]|jgi:formate C-acetyltransferase|nr:hypothetical protein [Oscillospiraceae bacterium]
MADITLKDIRLSEYTLDNLDGIKDLSTQMMKEPVHICIERAQYITEYMQKHNNGDPGKNPVKYRAEAVYNYLINKKAIIPDKSLIAGTTGSYLKTAPVYPEFIGLTIWSELETISGREKNPQLITETEAEKLNFDIYPYWLNRDVLSSSKNKYGNIMPIRLLEKLIFYVSGKAGCISHTVPDFKKVLSKGMNSIIEEADKKLSETADDNSKDFYEAVSIVLKGVVKYSQNLADEAERLAKLKKDTKRQSELLELSKVCRNVPANPAGSFREAVNCIWLCLIAVHAENINMAISPGRLDRILYPYYKKDIESGILTVKEAMELVACLWIKTGDNVDLVPQVSEELFGGAGTAPAVTLGGIDENGNDAVNDLTYIMLRVTELLKMREPNMNARYYLGKNSIEYRNRVSEVIASTKAVPAFHNDIENIKTLMNQGISEEHANDYAIIGCVELASAGKSYDASSSIILNLTAAFEMALYNGKRYITGDEQFGPLTGDPTKMETFDEFMTAFKEQTKWLIAQAIDLNEKMALIHQNMLPSPILSALFEGPMDKGRDLIFGGAIYNSSGATHVGFADVADSLNSIEKAVYDDKYCTFKELINAVRSNFKNNDKLVAYLKNKTLKYGTSEEIEQGHSVELIKFLYDTYQSHTNYRGGKYRPAYWTMTNHSGQGKITYALPNGRKANQPFASGITPVSETVSDLTECLNSVAALNSLHIPGSEALNIKFTDIKNAGEAEKLGQFVEAYFISGGQQIQFNIMSHEMLRDAKKNPDKYPDLLVRVSGYSAYFNDLSETMKDELITRTEYGIEDGRMVL